MNYQKTYFQFLIKLSTMLLSITFLLLILYVTAVPQDFPHWDIIGPAGADISKVAFNPSDPSQVYAFVRMGGVLFKSNDYGENWSKVAKLGSAIFDMEINPDNPNNMVAISSGSGFFYTYDGGENWHGYFQISGNDIEICKADTNIIWATGSTSSIENPTAFFCNIMHSTDAGRTWSSEKILTNCEFSEGECIAISPFNPDTIFIGGRVKSNNIITRFLMKSFDGGNSWIKSDDGIPGVNVFDILIDPQNRGRIYVSGSSGIYVSNDWGESWNHLHNYGASQLLFDPQNSNIIYGGGNGRIMISKDEGITWNSYTSELKGVCNSIAVNPLDNNMLIFASNTGLYKSTDGGENWFSISNDFIFANITSFCYAPSNYNITKLSQIFSAYNYINYYIPVS